MSGSIGGLGTLLVSLYGDPSDPSDTMSSLLSTLYGYSGAGSTADPTVALRQAEADATKDTALEAQQPSVARDIAGFESAVASAKSPADLLKNPTVLTVLLSANGLGDQASYPALAQKALLSDPADPGSLVNQLAASNPAWLSTAKLFNFATSGLADIQKPGVAATIANGYAEVQWRQSLDATTPGLSAALTFKQNASTFTTADQILGDANARDVVTTALGIPQEIAFQTIGAQEKAITSQLDITKLQDPTYVNTLTMQYLLAKQQAAASASASDAGSSLDSLTVSAGGLVV